MTYLAILAMMLMAFAVVGWPLVSPARSARRRTGSGSPWDDLISQRDAAYRAIKELDFEYELGNLSESDYRGLRERYRSEAAATLQKLDAAVKGASPGGTRQTSGAASTREARTGSPQAGLACPSCGGPTEAGDRYCRSCGTEVVRRCPSCAGVAQEEDRFCAACGCSLEAAA